MEAGSEIGRRTPAMLREQVLECCAAEGFPLARCTPVALPPEQDEAYLRWIAAGHHGEMAYLAQRVERGVSPDTLLPGVRSVISLAVNYFHEVPATVPGHGKVAMYARLRDYHRTLGKRLRKLKRRLRTTLGGEYRALVDSGPLLERAYAAAAGLGYQAKNSCLITREHGSWVLLAEVLTTLELTAAPPPTLEMRCGSCRRCVDACPTQAILPDLVIDSRRCISYLTIEHPGGIPEPLRAGVGSWIFGCDVCQDVCPHNHRARPAEDVNFRVERLDLAATDLAAILALPDDAAFEAKYATTPVLRTKRRGLLRNACVAAGNSGRAELIAPLQALLARTADEMLREHARWALAELAGGVTGGLPSL